MPACGCLFCSGWSMKQGKVVFPEIPKQTTTIASDALIERTLSYAKDLERIV